MNFYELEAIIAYLKKSAHCQNCRRHFKTPDFHFMATFENEGLVKLTCHHCEGVAFIGVSVNKIFPRSNPITFKDVEDVQGFLKNFQGDFKQIFS